MSRESVLTTADDEEKEQEEKMNLDKFLANHTSEDNESFKEIQEEAFKRHRYAIPLLCGTGTYLPRYLCSA